MDEKLQARSIQARCVGDGDGDNNNNDGDIDDDIPLVIINNNHNEKNRNLLKLFQSDSKKTTRSNDNEHWNDHNNNNNKDYHHKQQKDDADKDLLLDYYDDEKILQRKIRQNILPNRVKKPLIEAHQHQSKLLFSIFNIQYRFVISLNGRIANFITLEQKNHYRYYKWLQSTKGENENMKKLLLEYFLNNNNVRQSILNQKKKNESR